VIAAERAGGLLEEQRGGGVKAGDLVRLVGIPSDAKDDEELQTRTLFETCAGKTFLIAEIETVEGLNQQLAKLDVGHVFGEPSHRHTIRVEEKYLKVENSN
jgi:hypothetical protein